MTAVVPLAPVSVAPMLAAVIGSELTAIATIAAVVLAVVFAVAGLTKAADPATTAEEMSRLGVPAPKALARIVPVVEWITAASLVVVPAAGGALALPLLIAFTVVLVIAVRSGRRVSCGCLGSFSREPVSWLTVARNGGLMLLAVVALAAPEPAMPDVPTLVAVSTTALLLAAVLQLVLMRRQLGRLWSVALAGETRTPDRRPGPARPRNRR